MTRLAQMLQGTIQQTIRQIHKSVFRRALPNKLSIYFHSPAGFVNRLEELLGYLQEQGYTFVSPCRFLTGADKICFLSFDDNYRSWLQTLPVLERHRAHATFYINSRPFRDRVSSGEVRDYIEARRPTNVFPEEETTLSTAELQEIAAAGHVIGAHTHTHPVLADLPYDSACAEIRICREELGSLLLHPPEHFAYPYGMRRHFTRSLRIWCQSVGFQTIANAIPCMQYARSRPDNLYRSPWFLERPLAFNLDNLRIDGRVFSSLTGRSAAGGSCS